MGHLDLAIYAVHGAFRASFGLTRMIVSDKAPDAAPTVDRPKTAPFSRLVFGVHFLAFGVMYFGLANTVMPGRVPAWSPGQRIAGTLVMAAGEAVHPGIY